MTTRPVALPLILAALLTALLHSAQAAGADPVDGLYFSHHDWEIACDNTRTCRVAGYQAGDDAAPVSVLFTRAAGPGAPVTGELRLGEYDESPTATAVVLRIDDSEVPGEAVLDAGTGVASLPASHVAALLAVLPGHAHIALHAASGHGSGSWTLSGRGAAAVLLKMDEFQGRLDTPGALIRKGERDERGVLPALPAPVLRAAPVVPARAGDADLAADPALRQALRESLDDEAYCDLLSESEPPEPLTVHRLDAEVLLVSTPCWRGAYNAGDGYWLINASAPYEPRVVTLSGSDYADGEIGVAHKGRGLGDCWSSETWVWNGRDVVQASAGTTGLCRLLAPGGAWQLPTRVSSVQR